MDQRGDPETGSGSSTACFQQADTDLKLGIMILGLGNTVPVQQADLMVGKKRPSHASMEAARWASGLRSAETGL